MKSTLSACAILLLAAMPASAHRLDEYLQATLITVGKDRVQARLRLIPGVAVLPIVLGNIDTDGNEAISEAERTAYVESVLHDLSLTVDGEHLPLRLVSMRFPKVEEMKQGLGEILLELSAAVPRGGPNRRLVFENHHQSRIAAYLVNCLVPQDPDIRIASQNRDYQQSIYQLDYVQAGGSGTHYQAGGQQAPLYFAWLSGDGGWLGMLAVLLSARLAFLWRHHRAKFRSHSDCSFGR